MFDYFLKNIFLFVLFFNASIGIMTAQDLSKHQWKNRILVVVFENADQENYLEQIRNLKANQEGLIERKLVIYQVRNQQYKIGLEDHTEWKKITNDDFHKMTKELTTDLSVILLGLDGGIKRQESSIFSTNELFRIIDSMPMRMQEMRRLNKRNK